MGKIRPFLLIDPIVRVLRMGILVSIRFTMFAGHAVVVMDDLGPLTVLLTPVLAFSSMIFASAQMVSLKVNQPTVNAPCSPPPARNSALVEVAIIIPVSWRR